MPIDKDVFDQELDASGLACPMPIVKAKKALAQLTSGQVLRVWSTDAGTVEDMPVLAGHTGDHLLASGQAGGRFYFLLKKA
jgi:tRNA 2-thiouridine synthesizing protein A